ncbi:hypothetical protein QAD02_001468 [Eretmocerus hayati]|uniref:Uncharacterized protein n=1 Tax=Eretmocerus hayati TaxID=131215 RepID=A0ACC2NG37_9HYME|nr:hypothetical protein QAD02_001468 [Eretmocerus hayati]
MSNAKRRRHDSMMSNLESVVDRLPDRTNAVVSTLLENVSSIDTDSVDVDANGFILPVRGPMLAKKITSYDNLKSWCGGGGAWSFEEKYDGERAIVAVGPNVVGEMIVYSRHLKPLPVLGVNRISVRSTVNAVMDAELVWSEDPDGERVVPICDVHERRKLYVNLLVFDLQWYKNEPITEKPLTERRALLTALFSSSLETNGCVRLVRHDSVQRSEDLIERFEKRCSSKEYFEGFVLKRDDSQYAVDFRSNDWVKMKKFNLNATTYELKVLKVEKDRLGHFGILVCGTLCGRIVCRAVSGLSERHKNILEIRCGNVGRSDPRLSATLVADKVTASLSLRHPVVVDIHHLDKEREERIKKSSQLILGTSHDG